jgi:hypothetical protein
MLRMVSRSRDGTGLLNLVSFGNLQPSSLQSRQRLMTFWPNSIGKRSEEKAKALLNISMLVKSSVNN